MEYEISPLGASLAPRFATLTDWSAANLGRVNEARQAYNAGRQ